MKNKKLKIKYMREKPCNKYYDGLISGYFDESEKHNEKQLFEHIETCNKCKKLFYSIKASRHITYSLKIRKDEFVNSLNTEDVEYNINKIMDKISLENDIKKTNKKPYGMYGFINWLSGLFAVNNYKKVIISAGSVAAVLAVFFFINMLFGSNNNLNLLPTKSTREGIDNAAGENRENADFIPETSKENNLNENDNQDYTDKSNLPVSDEFTGESGKSIVLYSYFNNGFNHDLSEKIDLAVNYYEHKDDNKYIGVFSFKTGDTNTINEKLTNLLAENEISAEIKIITGVNMEKLVEYIDRETIDKVFSDNFTGDVDYLVILIGR